MPDEATRERLRAWLAENLAQYKQPRWIEFVDVLPGNEPIGSPELTDTDGSVATEVEQEHLPHRAGMLESVLQQLDVARQNLMPSTDPIDRDDDASR